MELIPKSHLAMIEYGYVKEAAHDILGGNLDLLENNQSLPANFFFKRSRFRGKGG